MNKMAGRTQQNGGVSENSNSVVRSPFLDFFDRGNIFDLFIYLYRFDESKNVLFSYFVLNMIVENGRRVGHICLEMFIRVLKIVEGIMVEKRFVLFCVSRTLNFRHFRASSLYNVAVGGSVAEGQWDAQEARITPVRSSSSIFARLFLFLSELFPVSIMSNEFRMEFRIN